jgi:hypothetical protein
MRLALATCTKLPEWEVDDAPLHEALRAMGHQVEQPPWDADVDWQRFDGVLIRTTWDYTARRDAFVAWCHGLGERVHNTGAVVAWNTHKGYLRELEALGVPIVPTVWLEQGSRFSISELATGQVFLKPCVAANADGTGRFEATDPAAQAHADALVATGDAMLQPFLPSVGSQGERSAIVVDGVVTHCVCKVPAAGDYRVQDDFGATDGPHSPSEAEAALIQATLAALPTGLLYARIDWLLSDDGAPMINEVELVEPSLFFRHAPHAAEVLARAFVARIRPRT